MNAQLIVEVAPEASPSTIALAAAARQTGGKLVCIVPEPMLGQSQKVIDNSGLKNMVEFKTGDPVDHLASYKNIDFSLVNCNSENYMGALEVLDAKPSKGMVLADDFGHVRRVNSLKFPMRKSMEVTVKNEGIWKKNHRGGHSRSRSWGDGNKITGKSKWVTKIDPITGEQHIYRLTKWE